MASLDFHKYTTSAIAALGSKHFDSAARQQLDHANKDIDKSRSGSNYTIGCNDWSDALQSLQTRVKDVDAKQPPQRIRSDRKTAIMAEIKCPDFVHDTDAFFKDAYNFFTHRYGSANVHGAWVHKDEVHDYIGKDGLKHKSLEHMHVLLNPYTRSKGINAKAMLTRDELMSVQREWNEHFKAKYHRDYNVHSAPQHEDVEQLKAASQQALQDLTKGLNLDRATLDGLHAKTKAKGVFGREQHIEMPAEDLRALLANVCEGRALKGSMQQYDIYRDSAQRTMQENNRKMYDIDKELKVAKNAVYRLQTFIKGKGLVNEYEDFVKQRQLQQQRQRQTERERDY